MSLTAFVAFDLGNVLLPFDHRKPCRALALRYGVDAEWVFTRIFGDGLEERFESGEWSGDQFMDACERALDLELDRATFPELWSDIFETDEDMERLIADIRPQTRLCLVSNTNPWHFAHASRRFPVLSGFKNRVLSFEVGCLKPDARIFMRIQSYVGNDEFRIYVDDLVQNVSAAEKGGFRAVLFRGAADLRIKLDEFGLLA